MPLLNLTQSEIDQIRAGFALAREFRGFAEEFERKRFWTPAELAEAFWLVTRLESYLEKIKESPTLDCVRETLRPLGEKVKQFIKQ